MNICGDNKRRDERLTSRICFRHRPCRLLDIDWNIQCRVDVELGLLRYFYNIGGYTCRGIDVHIVHNSSIGKDANLDILRLFFSVFLPCQLKCNGFCQDYSIFINVRMIPFHDVLRNGNKFGCCIDFTRLTLNERWQSNLPNEDEQEKQSNKTRCR